MRERDSGAKTAKNPSACPRCGTEGHSGSVCRFKDKHCNYCKKKGHIARVCRKRMKQPNPGSPKKKISYVKGNTTPESSNTTAESGGDEDLIATVEKSLKSRREERDHHLSW